MPTEETVLLVALCGGHRCGALRTLHADDHECDPTAVVRAAVRSRRHAVLMTTGCLGPCANGAVAVVGWCRSVEGRFDWTEPPLALSVCEHPSRARDLADWIATTAPDRDTLPDRLRTVDAA